MLVFSAMASWSSFRQAKGLPWWDARRSPDRRGTFFRDASRAPAGEQPVRVMPHARGALLRSCPKRLAKIGGGSAWQRGGNPRAGLGPCRSGRTANGRHANL